jgi:hypothetical protein
MAIRKYQKPHLCKHAKQCLNVLVRVKESCQLCNDSGAVSKGICRECDYFQTEESEDENE